MINMTLNNIAKACDGKLFGNEADFDTEISQVTTDSRKIEKNCLFIAIKGARSDGHDYIEQTFEQGALCAISEKKLDTTGNYILVEDSLVAIKKIATFYRQQLSITVVGITGSVGKTSTKETIASVLEQKYRVLKTLGNFNNELGLPLTIFRLTEEDEIAVLEMGISDFSEMHRLSEIAKPDICVITNIGVCHLENLKTRDGILKAKTEIFDFMNPNGTVILNGDDDKLSTVNMVYGNVPTFFGFGDNCDVTASDVKSQGLKGSSCVISTHEGNIDVNIPVPGEHMVMNALAATAVAKCLDLSNNQIKMGLSNLKTIAGRNHIIFRDDYTIIDDCYNANPVSMKASIDVLCMADTRKVAVLGDMGELGDNEKKLHYELGEYIADTSVDILLLAGELSREIERGFKNRKNDGICYRFDTTDELRDNISNFLSQQDSILVKASHFMKFEEIVNYLNQ